MGTLTIDGTVHLSQFWPTGKSDADTAKLIVGINPASFKFNGKATNIYFEASAKGKDIKKVVSRGKITLRLQGIDAPELHYKMYGPLGMALRVNLPPHFRKLTDAEFNKFKKANTPEYRQAFSETATVKLGNWLSTADTLKTVGSKKTIDCKFISKNIKIPSDAVDTYGRFVGDVNIKVDGKWQNVNHWVLENGWAFVSLYNSMLIPEMKKYIKAAETGRKKIQRDIYTQFLPQKIPTLINFDMQFRPPKTKPVVEKENGKVLNPKLFRRLTAYSIFKKAGINVGNTFLDYMNTKEDKGLYLRKDFFIAANHEPDKQESLKVQFHKTIASFINNNFFSLRPEEMVFIEDDSELVDKNNKPINGF